MDEILDDDFDNKNDEDPGALTKYKKEKSIAYLIIMQLGGMLLSQLAIETKVKFFYLIRPSFAFLLACLCFSFVVTGIGYLLKKMKAQKRGFKKPTDPFWFATIEGGFAFWILFAITTAIGKYFF